VVEDVEGLSADSEVVLVGDLREELLYGEVLVYVGGAIQVIDAVVAQHALRRQQERPASARLHGGDGATGIPLRAVVLADLCGVYAQM
jgi:hydrogenase maturation factor